jgi:hypothetical protein
MKSTTSKQLIPQHRTLLAGYLLRIIFNPEDGLYFQGLTLVLSEPNILFGESGNILRIAVNQMVGPCSVS